jgi:hypothetical protein
MKNQCTFCIHTCINVYIITCLYLHCIDDLDIHIHMYAYAYDQPQRLSHIRKPYLCTLPAYIYMYAYTYCYSHIPHKAAAPVNSSNTHIHTLTHTWPVLTCIHEQALRLSSPHYAAAPFQRGREYICIYIYMYVYVCIYIYIYIYIYICTYD